MTPGQVDLIRTFFSGMCCFFTSGVIVAFCVAVVQAAKRVKFE